MGKLTLFALGALFGAAALLGGEAILASDASPVPDVLATGKNWTASSDIEKECYLVGMSNLMSVEYAFQQKAKTKPTDDQTIIRRLYEEIDDVTFRQAAERIDQWYEKNPGKLDEPILVAIWLGMVEPNLKKEGR